MAPPNHLPLRIRARELKEPVGRLKFPGCTSFRDLPFCQGLLASLYINFKGGRSLAIIGTERTGEPVYGYMQGNQEKIALSLRGLI